MPELPEVKTVVKYLNRDIKNQTILDASFLVEKMVKNMTVKKIIKTLTGTKIKSVSNYGKFILFDLSDNLILVSHLRMEGKYRFSKELILNKHDHAWFKFKSGYLIYSDVRKFGTYEIKKAANVFITSPLDKLGKLPQDTNQIDLYNKIHNNKRIAIKSALLDQTILLGLGNIYVDEVLFAAKIMPDRKSSSITKRETAEIIKQARRIMKEATKKGGSSIRTYFAYNKIKGNYQNYLLVHTKAGDACPYCKNKILKMKVNGRGTYYCGNCQK